MTMLKIEIFLDAGSAQPPQELLVELADRIDAEGLPGRVTWLLRDFTGQIVGNAIIAQVEKVQGAPEPVQIYSGPVTDRDREISEKLMERQVDLDG